MKSVEDDGYGVSSGYTYGYYRRLSPTWLRLAALIHGVPWPEREPFRYFELGYGQGVSLNIHAATNPGEYWGTDYNPAHHAFASNLAAASGANLNLLGLSFEELAERDDLPQFHVVVAHGIWSWISEGARAAILRFLDRHLAPGGLFYVSYNALPGAASGIAVQNLVRHLVRVQDPALPEQVRFDRVRAQIAELRDAPGGHFAAYPQARERLDRILKGGSAYLLHEYTTINWQPMLLADVAAQLGGIGLSFAGSANIGARHAELLGGETFEPAELVEREVLRDYRLDRPFRADLFVRGDEREPADVRGATFARARLALVADADDIEMDGELEDAGHALTSLRDILRTAASDPCRSFTLDEGAECALSPQLLELALDALEKGALHPARDYVATIEKERSRALNARLREVLLLLGSGLFQSSPLLGGGVGTLPAAAKLTASAKGEAGGATLHLLAEAIKRGTIPHMNAVQMLKLASDMNSERIRNQQLMIV